MKKNRRMPTMNSFRKAHDRTRDKVAAIFRRLSGKRLRNLNGAVFAGKVRDRIGRALVANHKKAVADEIAFHLVDWNSEAAFLVAVLLFPERFTPKEIRAGVSGVLNHVPWHIIAAARLGGASTEDIFMKADKERLKSKRRKTRSRRRINN